MKEKELILVEEIKGLESEEFINFIEYYIICMTGVQPSKSNEKFEKIVNKLSLILIDRSMSKIKNMLSEEIK